MTTARDLPFNEAAEKAERLAEAGFTIFQKWSCAHCDSRQTMDQPNKFFEKGICEVCDSVTDLTARGCGYTAMISVRGNKPKPVDVGMKK